MCGRFAFVPQEARLRAQFGVDEVLISTPRYNIPPTATVLFLCIVEGQMKPLYLRWGLVPSWVKDLKKIGMLNNARAETVFEKPAFKHAARAKRGIIVMSGFYEWHTEEGRKQPYYFKQQADEYLAIAALWDTCQLGTEVIHSCALVTTRANELMAPVHERMPVILPPPQQQLWMNNEMTQVDELKELLLPYEGNDLVRYPVTPAVNSSRFDSPEFILPISKA